MKPQFLRDLEACCWDGSQWRRASFWLQVSFQLRQQWASKRERQNTLLIKITLPSCPPPHPPHILIGVMLFSFHLCSAPLFACPVVSPLSTLNSSPAPLSCCLSLSSLQTEKKKKIVKWANTQKHKSYCGAICTHKKKKTFVDPQWEGFDVKLSRIANRPTRKIRDSLFLWCAF